MAMSMISAGEESARTFAAPTQRSWYPISSGGR